MVLKVKINYILDIWKLFQFFLLLYKFFYHKNRHFLHNVM